MTSRNTPLGRRLGIFAAAALIGLSALLSGCDVLYGTGPQLTLEIRSQPGDGTGYDPESVTAPADTRTALSFVNVGNLDHNLVFLDPLNVRTQEIVRPGDSERLVFVTPQPGRYEFVCTIHEDMKGFLLVR
jgi:plastocyanin